jgi:hypothetical protein
LGFHIIINLDIAGRKNTVIGFYYQIVRAGVQHRKREFAAEKAILYVQSEGFQRLAHDEGQKTPYKAVIHGTEISAF